MLNFQKKVLKQLTVRKLSEETKLEESFSSFQKIFSNKSVTAQVDASFTAQKEQWYFKASRILS